jgi:emfourin
MRIDFERTGGFAGMRLATTIDSDALSAEEAEKVREMIDAADFFNLPAVSPGPTKGADRFQYRLTVEAEGGRHTIQFTDATIPPRLRPLLQWVTNAARHR